MSYKYKATSTGYLEVYKDLDSTEILAIIAMDIIRKMGHKCPACETSIDVVDDYLPNFIKIDYPIITIQCRFCGLMNSFNTNKDLKWKVKKIGTAEELVIASKEDIKTFLGTANIWLNRPMNSSVLMYSAYSIEGDVYTKLGDMFIV
jgi:hypothetical protein